MRTRQDALEDLVSSFDIVRKRMFFRDAAAKSRISPSQWLAMRIVSQHPESTVKSIAEKMQITSSAATQLIEKLAQSKYVVRKTNSKDRRGVVIALAQKTATEVASLRKQALARMLKVFEVLDDKELEQLAKLHRKLADATQKQKAKK